MLVILTAEETHPEEAKLLTYFASFEGVRLHIRKPSFTVQQMRVYLEKIPLQTLQRSSLHSFHHLVDEFSLGGVHFTSKLQNMSMPNLVRDIQEWRAKGKKLSASLHNLEEDFSIWDYTFLSPVFTSISKQNYDGKGFCVLGREGKWIALGGISTKNIKKAKDLGYCGVAALGSIWQDDNPKQAFEKIYEEYEKHFA